MKKLVVLSLLTVMLLGGGFLALVYAQSPGIDLKPTIISPIPGLYVNGWPAFTVSYPKEWAVLPPLPGSAFSTGVLRPDLPVDYFLPSLLVIVIPTRLPLEDWAKIYMPGFIRMYTDLKVLSDKPSQLKDGTPAWEAEIEGIFRIDSSGRSIKNGPKANALLLTTKKEATWVSTLLTDDKKIGEDLRRIAYSLTFQPDRDGPVKVPPDVQTFLDMYCTDIVNHDAGTVMAHFSDRFLNSGAGKALVEQWFRNDPASPIQRDVISQEATVTVFEPHGDKAYIDGFFLSKAKGDANALKEPMMNEQIINEHGQWKWFGNQK